MQAELQKAAEQAEQNQLAYLANRDQAVSALTSAWNYQDANSIDIIEDIFVNPDNYPPTFVAPDGQVIPTGVSSSTGDGVGVGPVSGPLGLTPSYGQGTGEVLANAANNNLSEVNRLRNNVTSENFEQRIGPLNVTYTRSGETGRANLNPGVLQTLYKSAVLKGIGVAAQRHKNANQ